MTWGNSQPVSPIPCVGQVRDAGVLNPAADFSVAPIQMIERTSLATRNPSVPLEDEATYYFFHNFGSADPNPHNSNPYYYVLPTLYQQDSSFGVLPKIIDAIGLACISNRKRSPELMVAAGQKYARVLRTINASIQDSEKATTDQTLLAIMLLGLFEVSHYLKDNFPSPLLTAAQTVTCSNPESMRSWANHVNGAIAIARLRGTDQLRTKIGRKIFAIVRLQVVSHRSKDAETLGPDLADLAHRLPSKAPNRPSRSHRMDRDCG